jgi:hypothetical protein
MTDYFGEKTRQVEPSVLQAFGINIISRYGQADELIELMQFAQLAAAKKVSQYVKVAFYDSKAFCCTFELDASIQQGDLRANTILEAATASISVFLWFDTYHHGGEFARSYARRRPRSPRS